MKKGFPIIFFRTINLWLTILFIVSIAIVFVMDMWLLDIKAPYKFFVAMGKFNYGVAVSYIAAYIFYLISVHYPETKSVISTYTAAHFPASAIVSNVEYIFVDMAQKLGRDIKCEDLNEDVIRDILSNTKCFGDSTTATLSTLDNGSTTYVSWLDYLKHKKNTIEDYYKDLHPLYTKLDGKYIEALGHVEQDNALFAILSTVPAALLTGHYTPANMYFKNGLDNILLKYYGKILILKEVIGERDETFDINNK